MAPRTSSVILLAATVAQVLVSGLIFSGGFNAATAGSAPTALVPNLATPAPYAFAIWGPIYLGAVISALLQLKPRLRDDPALARARPAVILGCIACSVWIFAARYQFVLTAPIILVMYGALWTGLLRSIESKQRSSTLVAYGVIAPLGLFTGWVGAASFVNCGDLIFRYLPELAGDGLILALGIVALAALAAIAMAVRSRAELFSIMAQIWALVAIIITNRQPQGSSAILAVSGIAIAALLAVTIIQKRRAAA